MSSASAPLSTIRAIGSTTASVSSALDVVSFEACDRVAEHVGYGRRFATCAVDVDERLVGGHHQPPVGHLVGRELERDARAPEARDADIDLELVVEARGC